MRRGLVREIVISLLLVAAIATCRPGGAVAADLESRTMARQLGADLKLVRQARILFHHHSVGANVLAGIEALDREGGWEALRIVRVEDADATEGPALLHGGGGRNGAPKSKMDAFASALREPARAKPQLAFMKLCYVDFDPSTNVDDLFAHYQRTMEVVKRENPTVRFGHVTVPLFRRPTDLKSSGRRLLRLEVWEDAANVKRAEFNARMREAFATDPVFDLARVEATDPEGHPVEFEWNGRRYPSLHPGYTEDGGHLNDAGQRAAGTAAIHFLADALRPRGVDR